MLPRMASPLTLRLDAETRARIERIARRKGLSTSELVRLAIATWTDRQELTSQPYEAMSDLIGTVRGGDPRRSEQAGRKFATLLRRRREHYDPR